MSNPDNLEYIAAELRKVAQKYSDAVNTLTHQARQLDGQAQDMTIGVDKWAGKGSQSFLNAWSQYQYDTQRPCDILGQTSIAMSKLAGSIEDNVTAIRNAQAESTVGFILTGALVIVDIAQLGLDPLTDAATVGAASEDTALVEQAQTAEEEISQADSQISVELEEITSQIENSSMTGSVEMPIEDDAVVSDGTTTEFFQKGSEAGSTITSTGRYYLQLIENKGVLVVDDPDTQAYMKSNLAACRRERSNSHTSHSTRANVLHGTGKCDERTGDYWQKRDKDVGSNDLQACCCRSTMPRIRYGSA